LASFVANAWTTLRRKLSSIGARFMLVNAFLVLVPLAGLSFARTYERELLRSEEEGMVTLARTLGAVAAADLVDGKIVVHGTLEQSVRTAAGELKAQIRVLDAQGVALIDTGAEAVQRQTNGRALLDFSPDSPSIRSILPDEGLLQRGANVRDRYSTTSDVWVPAPAPTSTRSVEPPPDSSGNFSNAPEVKKALTGASGRYTRVPTEFRGVRLYVAEPVRVGKDGPVVGVLYVSRTTYPVLVALYRARDGLYRVAGLSLIFAIGIAGLLGFTIARPLRRLGQAAGRIARGERGVSLQMKGNDEVAELARAFDKMAHELDARLSYISELSANVSHEFKTPIASIRGSAELLRDGAADDPEARERFLGHILTDTERMTRLVSRLLELSRIEASHEQRLPIDFRALVEEEVDGFRSVGENVRLVWSSDAGLVLGLPNHLAAALRSLIENGLRHGNADGVTVRVEREGNLLRTDVVDQGEGISEANLTKMWERFFTTERAKGGTGIGLSIVRAVVEAHGGSVHAVSQQGQGACFSFRLPLLVGSPGALSSAGGPRR
jgi:two-component system, OmpR family, sensor histidine kinase ChvG